MPLNQNDLTNQIDIQYINIYEEDLALINLERLIGHNYQLF